MKKISKFITFILILFIISKQLVFADTKDISLKIKANNDSLEQIEEILNKLEINDIDMSTSEEQDEKTIVYTTITDNFIIKTYIEEESLKKMTLTLGTTKEESSNTYIIYNEGEEKNIEPFLSYINNEKLSKELNDNEERYNNIKYLTYFLVILLIGCFIGLIILFLVYSRMKEEKSMKISELEKDLISKENSLDKEIKEHTQLKDISDEQKDTIDELNKKIIENNSYINNVNRCVAKLNKELKEEKQLKEDLIKNLENLHEKNLTTINNTHQNEISKLKNDYDERIKELEENNKGLQKIISKMQ